MKKLLLFQLIFFLTTLAQAQKIKEVKIGEQIWMSENLNVDKFRNGDPIPEAKAINEFIEAGKQNKPCYFSSKYSKLYNWYALTDSRGLASAGYHVPSIEEWDILINHLNPTKAGQKMKTTNKWKGMGENLKLLKGTNESGFSALPNGVMNRYDAIFENYWGVKYVSVFWSSSKTEINSESIQVIYLGSDFNEAPHGIEPNYAGLSVRCVKD